MYLAVVLAAAVIVVLYILVRYLLRVNLSYGIAGLFLLILPHTIGMYRSIDRGTCIATLILSVIGIMLLVADVAKQRRRTA